MAFLTGIMTLAKGQSHSPVKKFEIASIKEYKNQDGNFMIRTQPDGTFRAVGATLKMLIMFAYNVKAFQVSGASGWVGTELWDVEAKPDLIEGRPPGLDSAERLRALLEERYRLKIHRGQRTVPIYALVAEKRGALKLAPAASDAQRGICPCGLGSLAPKRASMSQLADQLSTRLWRIVVDNRADRRICVQAGMDSGMERIRAGGIRPATWNGRRSGAAAGGDGAFAFNSAQGAARLDFEISEGSG